MERPESGTPIRGFAEREDSWEGFQAFRRGPEKKEGPFLWCGLSFTLYDRTWAQDRETGAMAGWL